LAVYGEKEELTMKYVWIDEESREAFQSVLPKEITKGTDHVCIGACDDDDCICGALCYRYAHYQYDVLWIFVAEERRRQGVGTYLMDLLFRVAMMSGEVYPVSARFEATESPTLHAFFLSYQRMDLSCSHYRYYIEPREIRGARVPRGNAEGGLLQEEFLKLPEVSRRKILQFLQDEENYVPEEYEIWEETLVPELSRCVMKEDSLLALLFVQNRPDGNLELSYLYSKYPPGLAELLGTAASDMEEYYPQAKLVFDAVSDESARLATRIFPNAKTVPVYEAER